MKRNRFFYGSAGLIAIGTAAIGHDAVMAGHVTVPYRTVAVTGDPVPGAEPGVLFGNGGLATPVINNLGQVAFGCSSLTNAPAGTARALFSQRLGRLGIIARAGGDAPGTSAQFTAFSSWITNDHGDTAFTATTNATAPNNTGIWRQNGSVVDLVVNRGDAAPGTGGTFNQLMAPFSSNIHPFRFNNAGQVVFETTLDTAAGQESIWSDQGSGLSLVARSTTNSPVVTGDITQLREPSLNDHGHIAFGYVVSGRNPNFINSTFGGILSRTGNAAPQTAGELFQTYSPALGINNASVVVARCTTTPTPPSPSGIFTFSGGPAQVSWAFSSGFTAYNDPVISAAGIAFRANHASEGAGVWSNGTGTMHAVVNSVMAAEGVPGATYFVGSNVRPTMNSNGDVALMCNLSGEGIDGSNNLGIWAEKDGVLHRIIQTGDTIEVRPGRSGTVQGLSFIHILGTGNEDGRPSSFNDRGELVFLAAVSGIGQAILVADVEPCFADADGDHIVGVQDLLFLLANWGPCIGCLSDTNNDGVLSVLDLLAILNAWGGCD